MVQDVDWDEQVVIVHLAHILARHYHRRFVLWLLHRRRKMRLQLSAAMPVLNDPT